MTVEDLQEHYKHVLDALDKACSQAGRKRADVQLVAVSKFQPYTAIATLLGSGQLDFGENYVQEALSKRKELEQELPANALRWHLIGQVQSRKAHLIAGQFVLVHSLDSRKLAEALERNLTKLQQTQDVLIEVNMGAEVQKAGLLIHEVEAFAESVLTTCPHLNLRGLMCLPPVFDNGQAARPYFARLRELAETLRPRLGLALPELSMGMSGDFDVAIAEGATLVRIGTGIFGPRPYPKKA